MSESTRAKQRSEPENALRRLDALVGEWRLEASVNGQTLAHARTTSTWIEGEAFLVQHTTAEPAPASAPPEWQANAPHSMTAIIGLDDSSGEFTQLYADARGVFRVYQMSLDDGAWKIWRDAPGFYQRFTGVFSDGGNIISGHWETSSDGKGWEHDFDLTYTKIST